MKKGLLLLFATAIIFTANAQVVSKDSINTLKDQQKVIELTGEINTQKLKLAELENSLKAKMSEKEKQAEQARESAEANSKFAADLSDDPNDRKLARKSKSAAKHAKQQSKQARRSEGSLKSLEDDIEKLKKSIERNERKLTEQENR